MRELEAKALSRTSTESPLSMLLICLGMLTGMALAMAYFDWYNGRADFSWNAFASSGLVVLIVYGVQVNARYRQRIGYLHENAQQMVNFRLFAVTESLYISTK